LSAINQKSVRDTPTHNHFDHSVRPADKHHFGLLHEDGTDFTGFIAGSVCQPQVLAVNATADASLALGLQTAIPADTVSIKVALDDVVNLAGFGASAASGTVASHATSVAQITLGHGLLDGTYSASISIAVSASIPAAHATVQMQITESFQLCFSGKGFVGASVTNGASSSGTVVAPMPDADTTGKAFAKSGATFDLAGFAASVLNTHQWDISFAGLAPGESLQAAGTYGLTISATAQLAGRAGPEKLSLYESDRSSFFVSEKSGPAAGGLFGMQPCGPGLVGPFHMI
jgi:hypothetical protein